MKEKTEESKINEWKQLILNNQKRLQEEKDIISKYGEMFHPANLDNLTKEGFKSFLSYKNNKHWTGINRQSNLITADMDKLKKGLKTLLDESRNIKERLGFLFPRNSPNYIRGLGRAVTTPILLMVYPEKYGVYNSKSEEGLRKLGLLPDFRGKSFAEKYIRVNRILNELASEYEITLWQLDEIIGCLAGDPLISVTGEKIGIISSEDEEKKLESYEDFGLESHLEDFLVENWEKLELGKKYSILEEDGDIVGQQYSIPIGIIDILTKSKNDKEWLVIELKKGKSSDRVVGQILRYIGWVKENMAKQHEKVEGLIVIREKDEKLDYALKTINNIKVMRYSVSFKLHK